MSSTLPAVLVQANEQLILAVLRAQAEAEKSSLALQEAAHLAGLDAATDLPQRGVLLDRLAQGMTSAAARATSDAGRLALLLVDLDNFREINDTLGNNVGDQVLRLAARRLASAVQAPDMVSRHGGDDFLVLLADVPELSAASDMAAAMVAALAVPCRVGDHVLRLTASIGISIYPDDGDTADGLIDRAVAAMYAARRRGFGWFVFKDEVATRERSRELRSLESLRQPLTHFEAARSEYAQRCELQRQANEQLVLAALGAQDLQAAAEHALRRHTELLAVVAHELRNPLGPISNAAVLLGHIRSDEPLLPRVKAVIERQVAHMTRLVADLLDMSRAHTGKLRVEFRRLDMTEVIDAAVDACRPGMDARLQHFDIQLPTCLLEVAGDPIRLSQIVTNLLDNASKYTHEGGKIGLAVVVAGPMLVLTVSDTGIGISAEALQKVFEPFVQEMHATAFHGAGMGIGLTVVRELVEAHGGTVVASSAGAGLGSQFVVSLPLAPAMP